MTKKLLLLALSLVLAGCASSPTQGNWSCRAVGSTCMSIGQLDNNQAPMNQKVRDHAADDAAIKTTIFGGTPAAWWGPAKPVAVTSEDAPRREADQTMRIMIAPFIDAQGDYHDRTTVYAVMRRADWWIVPPEPVTSEPAPGTRLDRPAQVAPVAPAATVSPAAQPVAAVKAVASAQAVPATAVAAK